jgi:hypothetical protein
MTSMAGIVCEKITLQNAGKRHNRANGKAAMYVMRTAESLEQNQIRITGPGIPNNPKLISNDYSLNNVYVALNSII